LDEPSGSTTMFDAMGRHDGIYTNFGGTITLGSTGAVLGSPNTSVTFSGKTWGEAPYSPDLNTDDFTIECWVKTAGGASMSPVSTFKPKYGFFWELTSGSFQACDGYGASDGFANRVATASGANTPNQWVHLAASYGAGGHLLYFNGQWDGHGPWANFLRNTIAPFRIGSAFGTGDGDLYFEGQVDEVVVYASELSADQILAHYTAGKFGSASPPVFTVQPSSTTVVAGTAGTAVSFTAMAEGTIPITYQWLQNGVAVPGATDTTLAFSGTLYYTDAASYQLQAMNSAGTNLSAAAVLSIMPPAPTFANVTNGLVLHLSFDNTYADASGRGNDGTPQGTPSFVPGKIGSGALHYDTDTTNSTYNYVSLGARPDLEFGPDKNFSVAYWVRLPAGALPGDLPFLCSATNSTFSSGITFAPSFEEGGWAWSLNGTGIYGARNSINNGAWHHLVHTFDRTGNGLTYLDGVLVDTTSVAGAGDVTTTFPINIGQDPTGTYQQSGSADLDDLAVWQRVLTPYDAYAVYYVASQFGKSFDTYGPVKLSINPAGSDIEVIWQAGTLLQADTPNAPANQWTPVPGATAPYKKITPGPGAKFYKVQL
jgi:Concanavalin A-like lectin/glucanases superfamily